MINNILKKIEKANEVESSKVELAKHEINLALADELKSTVKVFQGQVATYGKHKDVIVKSINAMKAASEAIKTNKDLGKKNLATAQKFRAQLDKLSKELGVNLQGSEPDKLLTELFNLSTDVSDNIEEALRALTTLK